MAAVGVAGVGPATVGTAAEMEAVAQVEAVSDNPTR